MVWNDEFDGNALDTTKWSCQIGNGYNGWGNHESQYYTAENVSVADGTLKITAKKEVLLPVIKIEPIDKATKRYIHFFLYICSKNKHATKKYDILYIRGERL